MHIILFFKGLIVGLIVSIPLGPMAILSIRRTISSGFLLGFATSLGVAIGDFLYAFIAGSSVSFIVDQIQEHEKIVGFVGASIIIILGTFLLFSHSKMPAQEGTKKISSLLKSIYTTILLSLSNPVTLLAFIALFSWVSASPHNGILDTVLIAAGVASGALIWLNVLNLFFYFIRKKLSPTIINTIHKASGILIILVGILMIFNLL
ncbi:hypothetical protein A3F66_03475 [candidate division TM6 bacterium RIFCSPHIGHO2_12_FULL_32_22]|nr:MAG: hypothetical protein A3F66_03475 [candidate division TM6 bacterium RIFCSPHIGHO2_12_FULL_32_22]